MATKFPILPHYPINANDHVFAFFFSPSAFMSFGGMWKYFVMELFWKYIYISSSHRMYINDNNSKAAREFQLSL